MKSLSRMTRSKPFTAQAMSSILTTGGGKSLIDHRHVMAGDLGEDTVAVSGEDPSRWIYR